MKKVLVVDDSNSIRNEVSDALGPAGFDVLQAADATEAFACLAKHRDVSMMVLDVNMPGMSGIELLERLRAERPEETPPVLMLTTEAERQLVERAKKAGAKGWLLKPIKPELLVSTVNRLAR
ncbi:MAG TPA: response regulator [Polyangiaceae bacterium]|nr:response regulator [Polyangiaceae bacterium]